MARVRTLMAATGACVALASCSTGGVTGVDDTRATLHGTVETRAQGASYVFQYATEQAALGTGAGSVTPRRTLAPNTASTDVSEALTGLTPGRNYFYRLCGRLAGATEDGCLATRRFGTAYTGLRVASWDQPGLHVFTVPANVFRIYAYGAGASGGAGVDVTASGGRRGLKPSPGGKGGWADGSYPVSPGERIEVRVGSAGGDAITTGSIYPGAGGAGGSNGVDRGGNGGSGNRARVTNPNSGANGIAGFGGGGGGAPSGLFVTRSVFTYPLLLGGGGGGGGGSRQNGHPATGGSSAVFNGFGDDGARSDAGRPLSTGGGPGGYLYNPIDKIFIDTGKGGLGGGKDGESFDGTPGFYGGDGGDGGSDTTPSTSCTPDLRFGGGGGGGGVRGGGGGGKGRYLISQGECDSYGFVYDGASGGGAGETYVGFEDDYYAESAGPNEERGDGFVRIWY